MVGPNYHRPALAMPAAYKEASSPPLLGWKRASPADGMPKGNWWTLYNDPDLDRLEPMVLISNQTVAAGYAAYRAALEIVAETRGGLFPTVGLTGSATRSGTGGHSGSTSGTGNSLSFSSGPTTSGTFEGNIGWTPDIWGKIRREVQGDIAAAQVSEADLANATLSEQAILAIDYVDLRGADANIALLEQTVAAYQRSLRITENQFEAGVAAPSDVITARAQLEAAQAQLINTGATRAQYEHAIAILTGQAPAGFSLSRGSLMSKVPEVPPGLPSALLERRPDIAAAERMMAEQNAQIGVAVAAFFPNINLSANGGYSADPIARLFDVSNALWSLGTDATATLFEGGTRSAAIRYAKFSYEESVANYRETVLTALQNIETDLSNLRILGEQAVVEQAAVDDAARAVQIALNEYEAGTQNYTTVVTAQATLLNDQETALSIQQQRLVASISLVQDLGGGWQSSDLHDG
jgi:NodT family efflux transporter outer membrane factor (OMF) lipoprotein